MQKTLPVAGTSAAKGVRPDSYEVADFAKKYGLPASEAKTIIKRYGPSRKKLETYMAARNA